MEALPDSYASKQGYLILSREFSFGLLSPAEVVVDGDVNSQPVQDAVARLKQEVSGDTAFYGAPKFEANSAGDLAVLSIPVSSSPDTPEATGAVTKLRQQYIPTAFEGVDARVLVDGAPAFNLDYFTMTDNYVLLDATVVRSVLVPSTMELLGDWNWYLPKWLSWLPDFRMGQGDA
ncbi:MAG: hypothetical protein ACYC5F_08775 [Thermoleophilia bacterium]